LSSVPGPAPRRPAGSSAGRCSRRCAVPAARSSSSSTRGGHDTTPPLEEGTMARRTTAAALALAAATLAAAGCGGSAADKAAKGNTIVSLRVIKCKGQVLALVPVQINGHAFTFALDTAAAGSLSD